MIQIPSYIQNLVIEKAISVGSLFIEEINGNNDNKVISYSQEDKNKNVLLFLHGFTGSPTETFKYIPELLIKDKNFDGFDIFSIGYSSSVLPDITAGIWTKKPDIKCLAEYFNTLLETHFSRYKSIAIVAHSMGGLIAQKAILELDENKLEKINHLILFGTPSNGLKKVAFFKKWIGIFFNSQINNLGFESDFIKRLRKDWNEKFNKTYPFKFETVAGTNDDFISKKSSILLFEKRYRKTIGGNHATMVKAESVEDIQSQCFRLILNNLTPFDVNNVKGAYLELVEESIKNNKTINMYEKEINRRDAKALKKLALAYDGLSREEDAIKIILGHPAIKTNTDTMGILAGRYKRKYLFSGLFTQDAENAVKWYRKALKISVEKNDKEQIYYHAINLAFMSLVYENKQEKMETYAQMALDNCVSKIDNIWEVATKAEAYLYLKNEQESEKYYTKVIDLTKDKIRQRSSIYINAKFAYEALYGVE